MIDESSYPDEPSEGFPAPPTTFGDREGRRIGIRALDPSDGGEREALASMYRSFDPADRAQGLPPAGEPMLGEWLDLLIGGEAVNVLAWHGDEVVGHATLVPDGEGAYELAIFVHQDYRSAGIGGRLIRHLLGEGRERGVERVWLTVERRNRVAIDLYRDVGFETADSEGFEIEMTIRLA